MNCVMPLLTQSVWAISSFLFFREFVLEVKEQVALVILAALDVDVYVKALVNQLFDTVDAVMLVVDNLVNDTLHFHKLLGLKFCKKLRGRLLGHFAFGDLVNEVANLVEQLGRQEVGEQHHCRYQCPEHDEHRESSQGGHDEW